MSWLSTRETENMETVVVYCARRTNQIQVPIGSAVIMNALKVNDLKCRFVDTTPVDPDERLAHFEKSLSPNPAIYAFGVTIGNHQIDEVEKCAEIVKRHNPGNIVIYGGPLASSSGKILAARSKADYVLGGEAEITFPTLVKHLLAGDQYPDTNEIHGLYYRYDQEILIGEHGGGSCGSSTGSAEKSLVGIGLKPSQPSRMKGVVGQVHKKLGVLEKASRPDYSEFDMDFYVGYLKETDQAWEIMGSRGCVAACSFCYKMVGNGLSVRSVEDVLDEMEWVVRDHGINKFYFVDDSLLVMRDWYRSFLKGKRERGLDSKFIIQARIDAIDEELVQEGVENGLICISTGVESTTQFALDKMRKSVTLEEVQAKIALVKKYGLAFNANMIIGFEWETETYWKEMLGFIEAVVPGQAKLNILTPLPSTTIYQQAKRRGLIGDEWDYIQKMGDLYFELIVNMTPESDEKLLEWYERIKAVSSRDVAFPLSDRYLSKLADHYYNRYPEERRLRLSHVPLPESTSEASMAVA